MIRGGALVMSIIYAMVMVYGEALRAKGFFRRGERASGKSSFQGFRTDCRPETAYSLRPSTRVAKFPDCGGAVKERLLLSC